MVENITEGSNKYFNVVVGRVIHTTPSIDELKVMIHESIIDENIKTALVIIGKSNLMQLTEIRDYIFNGLISPTSDHQKHFESLAEIDFSRLIKNTR